MTDQRGSNNYNWKGGRSSNHYEYTKKSRQRHPGKESARKVVGRALKVGKLSKPRFCQFPLCKSEKVEAHHFDYRFPLLVMWLCKKHHVGIHNGKYDSTSEAISPPEQMNFFSGTV